MKWCGDLIGLYVAIKTTTDNRTDNRTDRDDRDR